MRYCLVKILRLIGLNVSMESQDTHEFVIAKVGRMRLREYVDNFLRRGEHSDGGIKCVHRYCKQLVETQLVQVVLGELITHRVSRPCFKFNWAECWDRNKDASYKCTSKPGGIRRVPGTPKHLEHQ